MEGKEFKYILNRAGISYKKFQIHLEKVCKIKFHVRTIALWAKKREVGEMYAKILEKILTKDVLKSIRAEFQEMKKAKKAGNADN